jgi:hypothetical protein
MPRHSYQRYNLILPITCCYTNRETPSIMYMYNIKVYKASHTCKCSHRIYRQKTDTVSAVYDKGNHYVTNQKLTLDMLKEISEREEVLQVAGEYTGCCCFASMYA